MIPGSSHSLQFTRAPLYFLIHLGQRLNLISALNCFVTVSYGMGVRAAGYTRLRDSSSIVPPQYKTRDLHGTFIYKYWAFDREKRNVNIVITIYMKHKNYFVK